VADPSTRRTAAEDYPYPSWPMYDEMCAEIDRLRAAVSSPPAPSTPRNRDMEAMAPSSIDEARLLMVHELHEAVFGSTWARPESPAEVWRMLLETVERRSSESAGDSNPEPPLLASPSVAIGQSSSRCAADLRQRPHDDETNRSGSVSSPPADREHLVDMLREGVLDGLRRLALDRGEDVDEGGVAEFTDDEYQALADLAVKALVVSSPEREAATEPPAFHMAPDGDVCQNVPGKLGSSSAIRLSGELCLTAWPADPWSEHFCSLRSGHDGDHVCECPSCRARRAAVGGVR
jgi:hypothetical protein